MLTREQAKQGARVTARAGWGFWSGLTFGRFRADAAGALEAEIGETFGRLAPLYRRRLEEIGRGALAA